MKRNLLIITDLEGTPGMTTWVRDTSPQERVEIVSRHRRTVRLFCDRLLPVYRRLVVLEGHLNTLVPEALPEGVELVKDSNLEAVGSLLNENWDLAMIGAHGMQGAAAPLSHSFSSQNPQRWFIDGREVGEVGVLAAWAASRGGPLVLVHGFEVACREAERLCPEVQCVVSRLNDGTDLTAEEEWSAIEQACQVTTSGRLRPQLWRGASFQSIERRFVSKGSKQQLRALGFVLAWWLIRTLLDKSPGKPDCQRDMSGGNLAETIEAMLKGPSQYWRRRSK
jgi:D-aminopeptidase